MTVREQLQRLQRLVLSERDLEMLHSEGTALLEDLRRMWPTDRAAFSSQDISALQVVASQLNAVEELIDLVDEMDGVLTKEDAADVMHGMANAKRALSGTSVEPIIETHIRRLAERKSSLLDSVQRRASAQARRLAADGPSCGRCGKPMDLKQNRNDGSRFWACVDFPDCWSSRPLRKGEADRL